MKTCSLPCYKRHQQRASCNGKRDPTAYVKRDQLATAAGIDHDFNFLSGVERVFDKADKDRQIRGIAEADQSTKKRWNDNGALQRYLRQNNILVDRAPVGMSRQKANKTRYIQKSKKIVWSIEWVDTDGSKRMSEAHEAATLGDAYAAMLADRERESRKRKRSSSPEASATNNIRPQSSSSSANHTTKAEAEAGAQAANLPALTPTNPDSETASLPPVTAAATAPPTQSISESAEPDPPSSDPNNPAAPSQAQTNATNASALEPCAQQPQQQDQVTEAAATASADPTTHSSLPSGQPNLYLLRPHTTSRSKILIPLPNPSATLTSTLSDRTILEFPTIYILDQSAENLGKGFKSEEAYLAEKQVEDLEVEEFLRVVPGERAGGWDRRGGGGGDGNGGQGVGGGEGALDPGRILEMLRRDVPS